MTTILNRAIKDIINEFPEAGKILEDYGIACVACSAGTCRLRDVVVYHDVPEDRKQQMWARIGRATGAGAITPPEPPEGRTPARPAGTDAGYSPPLLRLVQEHVLIKRLLACIPGLSARLALDTPEGRNHALAAVDFIRNYADRYHHAKEEDLLFKYFDESGDIIQAMRDDHGAARAHVQAVLLAVEREDAAVAAQHLDAYRELLTGHIHKEDTVLFPWMDRNLDDRAIGELFGAFQRMDTQAFEPGHAHRYTQYIERLEHTCGRGNGNSQ